MAEINAELAEYLRWLIYRAEHDRAGAESPGATLSRDDVEFLHGILDRVDALGSAPEPERGARAKAICPQCGGRGSIEVVLAE